MPTPSLSLCFPPPPFISLGLQLQYITHSASQPISLSSLYTRSSRVSTDTHPLEFNSTTSTYIFYCCTHYIAAAASSSSSSSSIIHTHTQSFIPLALSSDAFYNTLFSLSHSIGLIRLPVGHFTSSTILYPSFLDKTHITCLL